MVYLAVAFDLVALISLFGGMGVSGGTAFLYFAIFGLIGGFFTLTIVKTQMAVTKRKKQLAELKKKGQSYISK